MLLAAFFTVLAVAVTVAIARRRRIHRAILALVAGGVAVGAAIGSIPGAVALIGLTVGAATGPSTGINWALWTTLAALGTLSGIALGAAAAGSVARPHVNRVAVRAASTAAFAILGVGLSAIVSSVTADGSTALLALLGALVTATSVLGFVVPAGR